MVLAYLAFKKLGLGSSWLKHSPSYYSLCIPTLCHYTYRANPNPLNIRVQDLSWTKIIPSDLLSELCVSLLNRFPVKKPGDQKEASPTMKVV